MDSRKDIELEIRYLKSQGASDEALLLVAKLLLDIREQNERITLAIEELRDRP